MTSDHTNFYTVEELAKMLEEIGMRLHAINRIAENGSGFLWCLAQTIRKAGLMAKISEKDHEAFDSFGDCFHVGTIPFDEQEARFLELLRDQKTDT